jgi:hypothetical protein
MFHYAMIVASNMSVSITILDGLVLEVRLRLGTMRQTTKAWLRLTLAC